MKKISVVIPLYNAVCFLNQLVGCLDKQTCKNFEVIFVDDCSKDNTVNELKALLETASFSYVVHKMEKNGGPGKARNYGISVANSEWACFIDADDFISPNFFEEMIAKINDDVDVVVSSTIKVWKDGREKKKYDIERYASQATDRRFLACTLDFGPWAKIFRLSLWRSLGLSFPLGIIGEDGAVIPALYYHARSMAFCEQAVYYYYQVPVSRSRNSGKNFDDILQACILLEKLIPDPVVMEYKYTCAVGYGVIMNAIRHGEPNAVICKYCDFLNERVPNGLKNRYIANVDWRKRLFIKFAYKKRYGLLRLLVKIGKR